ncbi:MAG TPA: hypothetical protein VGN15_11690 [Ktedonobacteraceae bacterium]|nr:hypothetical protein [Ktedonobacteraceae bacterium]
MSSATSEPTGKALRVAIIGYGLAGSVFHAPLVSATPGMTVAAIVTSQRQLSSRQPMSYGVIQLVTIWW